MEDRDEREPDTNPAPAPPTDENDKPITSTRRDLPVRLERAIPPRDLWEQR